MLTDSAHRLAKEHNGSSFTWRTIWLIVMGMLLLSLLGCATTQKALQVSSCVLSDDKLSIAIEDPNRAQEYLVALKADMEDMLAAIKKGTPPTEQQLQRIQEVADLIIRVSRCIQAARAQQPPA